MGDDLKTDMPKTDDPKAGEPAPAAEGDFRGSYGYGHKAHRPDPKATYTFDMNEPRTLPVKGTTY